MKHNGKLLRMLILIVMAATLAVTALILTACSPDSNKDDFTKTVVPATCTKQGYTVFTSKNGNLKYVSNYTELAPHELIYHSAVEPTCTEVGCEEYYTCRNCSYTTYVEIPALGHDIQNHNAVAPTCTTYGNNPYQTCSRCEYSTYAENMISPLGHDIIPHQSLAPTCDMPGHNAYESCTRCEYTNYEEIPAKGHALVHHGAVAPTCTENGNREYHTCSDCSFNTYFENIIPAKGHSLQKGGDYLAPTCTAAGHNEYYCCTNCSYSDYREIKPLGHNKQYVYDVALPTCTEAGHNVYQICTRCSWSDLENNLIPATGHALNYVAEQQPTCIDPGHNAYEYCSKCPYTTYAEVPALGHNLQIHDGKNPTCTEIGWNSYFTCARCDYTTYSEIAKLGHNCTHISAKASTCSEPGYEAYDVCARCDYNTFSGYLPVTPHVYSTWTLGKAPTFDAAGERKSYCDKCNNLKIESIPKLDHCNGNVLSGDRLDEDNPTFTNVNNLANYITANVIRYYDTFTCTINAGGLTAQQALTNALAKESSGFHYDITPVFEGNKVTAAITYQTNNYKCAQPSATTTASANFTHPERTRTSTYNGFKIELLPSALSFNVQTSEQLFYVVEQGYRPICDAGSDAERIYNAAKDVLRSIITDTMSDFEKITAIHDYIIESTLYRDETNLVSGLIQCGEYLEGVFYEHIANSQGFAKAFVLLCGIEGISAVKVDGIIASNENAVWNKVLLEGNWYALNLTKDNLLITNYDTEITTHYNFLFSELDSSYIPRTYSNLISAYNYDYYGKKTFEYNGKAHTFQANSQEEFNVIIGYMATFNTYVSLDVYMNFDVSNDNVKEVIEQALEANNCSFSRGYMLNGKYLLLIKR